MKAFRILLVIFFIGICVYTIIAGANNGWNLFKVFVDNLTAFSWSGQFNFDFSTYLILSGIWVAWREDFTPKGIVLGLIASVLGILFFAPYLLIISFQENGEMKTILLGKNHK